MLWVLLPLLCGVITATTLDIHLAISLSLLVVSSIVALLSHRKGVVYVIIFSFAMILPSLSSEPTELEKSSSLKVALRPLSDYSAEILAIEGDKGWITTHQSVIMSGRRESLSRDSITICRVSTGPNKELFSDRYRYYIYIYEAYNSISAEQLNLHPTLSERMHNWATARLKRLPLDEEEAATAAAIGVGERSGLSDEIRQAYARSGTAHILALSGMHIGVLFLLIRIFIYLFPLMRYGHIIADIVAIVAIWIFAHIAGLSDSVMRAAWMFTLLELSFALSRRYNSLNALFSVAVIMISFDPLAIYDLGFQLSFVAVAAIILWALPLARYLTTGYKLLDSATYIFVIGLIATLATAPLVSYTFGYISILSPITTPLVMLSLSTIIITSIVWIILPLPLWAPLAGGVIEVAATIQNYLVRIFATWDWGYFECKLPQFALYIIYAIYLLITLLLRGIALKRGQRHDSL